MITIPVDLGERSYEVIVGSGALSSLRQVIPSGAKKAVVVTQQAVSRFVGSGVDPGIHLVAVDIPDGEKAKSLAVVEELCRTFAREGLSRSDVVIAVGGGVTTDVAGLAAALFHRGIAYVNVPTTLLAQVDAAIGGKTGVNLPEGKNLAGAFWQPSAVLCDTDALATLDGREIASGRGEMAKYAFLGHNPPGTGLLELPIDEQVARCVELKVSFVIHDEREGDRRALLNYGHTLAHALEAEALDSGDLLADPIADSPRWDIKHGEAVAVGLVFAAELARRMGRIDHDRVEVHRNVIAGFGLSPDIPGGASARELVGIMGRDKKARGDLTFVLDGPRGVEVVRGVDPALVADTLIEMGTEP
ncbi:MAG: 3-dehydroquinate synthase family protein [Acidimicrobiales bacterium]|jgi:5-deoxy-5-amino-3-dehydroquinate synthase